MTISLTPTAPGYFQDSAPPALSYLSLLVTIELGQFFLDNTTGDFYICKDNSDQNNLLWEIIPRADQIINFLPERNQSSITRTFNNVFQPGNLRDAFVNYSIDISCTLSISSGEQGTVYLEMTSDPDFLSDIQEISRISNGNNGTLSIGLNIVQNNTGILSGYVTKGYYCRIRTENNAGTPDFTYKAGQEILL